MNLNRKYKVASYILTALIIVAVIIFNLLAASVTRKYNLKLDVTDDKQFEITDKTKEIMKELDTEVTALVMGTEDEVLGEIKEYLAKYEAMSKFFKVKYIDVYKNQSILTEYAAKGENLSGSDIILEAGERYKIISASSIYNQTMSFEQDKASFTFELESKLTNGIVVVSGDMNESKTYFLEGHGEQEPGIIAEMLSMLDFPYEGLDATVKEIPEDAGLLVSMVPTADFNAQEVENLEKYFERGGNMLVVFAPGMEKLENMNTVLEKWGIVPNYDTVYETDVERASPSGLSMITYVAEHDITNSLNVQGLPLYFDNTSSFGILKSNAYNAETKAIAKTSEYGLGKAEAAEDVVKYEEGDLKGALALAVASQRNTPKTSKMLVIGSSTTLDYAVIQEGNSEFLSGMVSWLTNNGNTLKIVPKIVSETIVEVPASKLKTMYYVLVWTIPGIILLAGIIIWIRRRYL